MEFLIITILVVIVGYIAFVVMFPKAIPEESTKHAREVLQQIYDETQSDSVENDRRNVLRDSLEQESQIVQGFYTLPIIKSFYPLLLQSGQRDKAAAFFFFYVIFSVVLSVVFLSLNFGAGSILLGPVAAYLLLSYHLKRKIVKRNAAFINTFPDVLDMFVRSVKSGFPVTTAFKMVAENMENPVKEEFERVVNELAIGQSINQTLSRLAQRINEPDIHFFVVVMKVQQETGGNLAEVVSNLSNVIRKRKQLRLKIRALTSEGRATAYILGALPVVVLGAIYLTNPDYVSLLWTDTTGMIWLGVASSLIVICMFVVKQMINIDI